MSQTSQGGNRDTVVARRIMARTYWNVRKLIRNKHFFSASSALQSMSYVLNDWAESDESYKHGRYAEEWLGNLFIQHCETASKYPFLYGYMNEEGEVIATPFEVLFNVRGPHDDDDYDDNEDDDEDDED